MRKLSSATSLGRREEQLQAIDRPMESQRGRSTPSTTFLFRRRSSEDLTLDEFFASFPSDELDEEARRGAGKGADDRVGNGADPV